MVNRKDLLFSTDRFNLSQVKPNFINPCCFGEDLADWLSRRLSMMGAEVAGKAYQEDWGWEFAAGKGWPYFIGIGRSEEVAVIGNYGEWRIFVERRRSLRDRLTGKGEITDAIPCFS